MNKQLMTLLNDVGRTVLAHGSQGGDKVIDNHPLEANGPQHKAEGGLDSGAVPDASTQRCPWCNEPIESEHPRADVYHLDCIMESTKHLREKK